MNAVMTAHRQFGSKARVASRLLRLVPDRASVWVEVFAGTAALTLAKPPHPAEHLNDLNGDITNLFRVMRDESARLRLVDLVGMTPYAEEEHEFCMNHVLAVPPETDDFDPVERARRFLVSSWMGIGGKQGQRSGWRLERAAGWLPRTWAGVPARIVDVAQRLRNCQIHRKHAADIVKMFGDVEEAILFVDPPYPRNAIDTGGAMYAVDMSAAEHLDLAQALRDCRCRVLLTMAPGTVYSDVLADWTATPFTVRGMRNSKKTELALTNYAPPRGDLLDELLDVAPVILGGPAYESPGMLYPDDFGQLKLRWDAA